VWLQTWTDWTLWCSTDLLCGCKPGLIGHSAAPPRPAEVRFSLVHSSSLGNVNVNAVVSSESELDLGLD
jgi:hypothetical protein